MHIPTSIKKLNKWIPMHITDVKINNFRLLQNFELKLNKGLNLLIGENNSGKTALVDAIRYTLDTNSSEWNSISENDFHLNSRELKVQLKFEGLSQVQAAKFIEYLTHEQVSDTERRSVLYVNLIAIKTDEQRRGKTYIKVEYRSGSEDGGPKIDKSIRDYLSITYLKPLRDAEKELQAGRNSRLSQILSSSSLLTGNNDIMDNLLQAMIDANDTIITNQGIIGSKNSINHHLKELIFESEVLTPQISIAGNKPINDMNDNEKLKAFKNILEKLSLSISSDGTQQGLGYNNLLFMATELLLLEQEQSAFPFLIIEESEAHIHPQLQMRFLKYIKGSESTIQSILSSHSPNLASKANVEDIILMSNGKAFPLKSDFTQLESDDYKFLEKFLDVTKSNLFFAKSVLFVEGDGENILIPTIAELVDRPLENYGCSLVNINNTAFARYAKIFKRCGLDDEENRSKWIPIAVACLRDLDLWPDKAEDTEANSPYGFKNKLHPNDQGRGGNLNYWKSNYNDQTLAQYIDNKKSIEGQNVKVYLSDDWTFEYSLIVSGLAKEVYEAVTGSDSGFDDLPNNIEEKAISIYKMIEVSNKKTETAYKLSEILKRDYSQPENRALLIRKLPQYIKNALGYVTIPIPEDQVENTETSEEQ